MHRALGLLAVMIAALFSISQAVAAVTNGGKKVALVIGNSTYQYAVTLPNPKSDASLMATTLRSTGFNVIEGTDLDKTKMTEMLDRFTEEAYDADVAVVYYAGHGLQVDGHNYLIPVDAQLEKAAQLQTRTVSVDKLLESLPPDPAVSVIILDACRDNPLARTLAKAMPASRSQSMGAGLAAVQASGQSTGSGGLLIAYATDPGAVAYDGKDLNSPYTTALARHLTTPGLEIQSALTRVRADVSDATNGAQRPWHNASLGREVFLGGDAPAPAVAAAPAATDGTPTVTLGAGAQQPGADVNWTVEQKLWDEASKRNTIAHYELYLKQFPNGSFAGLASLNIDQLKSAGATQVAALEPAGEASPAASQVRTAVSVPEDVKQQAGTPETETALNLDKAGRIDLQLRLSALGHLTGGADGALGPKSRAAIGAWQKQSGIVETTYLTQQQHMFLVVQTDPMMAKVRAQYEQAKAAQANARKVTQQKQVTSRKTATRQRDQKIGRAPSGGGFLDSPGGAAFVGGLVGGALGAAIGR
jgi:uncharacterized caspase-like protein